MIINTNMASLNTIRQLGVNEKATQSSLAKLSSGLRINTAADDAAGLAISEKMRGQISGLNQASSNAQNGINMTATAEGALNETTSILQRMRELAVQAGNDTNTASDRTAMQTETNQLIQEIDRIGNTTQFNTKNLLNGNAGFSGTADVTTGLTLLSGGTSTTGTYAISAINAGKDAQVQLMHDATNSAALAAGDLTAGGNFTVNGVQVTVAAATLQSVVDGVNAVTNQTGVVAKLSTVNSAASILLENSNVGSATKITITQGTAFAATVQADDVNGTTATAVLGTGFTGSGTDASATAPAGITATGVGNQLTFTGGGLNGVVANVNPLTSGASGNITVTSNNSLSLQIGANQGQTMNISIDDMRSAALGVSSIDLSNATNAGNAVVAIDNATSMVSAERSKLGAYQNRLEHTINNLGTASQNITSAEANIRDVDMAAEMTNFQKNNILQQAAQAMLAQANQQPQGVLQLLR